MNIYLIWFKYIEYFQVLKMNRFVKHLFLNKRSLFGLAGKGPWGRITHSEYVIRRMNRIWRPVLKTGYFWKRKDYRRVTLHRLISDLEVLSPLVTGSPDVIEIIRKCKGFVRSAFGSVRSRNRLVWIVCLTLQFEI